jgi:hypothetical protein
MNIKRALALTAAVASTVMVVHPAGAADDDVFDNYKVGHSWSARAEGRGYGPFMRIPYEAAAGQPYSRAELASNPGRCFTISSLFYGDQYGEEFLNEGGQYSFRNPGEARAENPTQVRNPEKVEVAPFGPNGPRAVSECLSKTEAKSYATYGWNGDATNHVGFTTTKSTTVLDTAKEAVNAETLVTLEDVLIGGLRIERVESWLKVVHPAGKEPVVSYRLALFGVSSGDQSVAGAQDKGVILAGNNVAGADLYKQFQDQANAHGDDMAQLWTYRIRVLSPKMSYDNVEYTIQAPVFEADEHNTPRKETQGDSFGFRLGEARYVGAHNANSSHQAG